MLIYIDYNKDLFSKDEIGKLTQTFQWIIENISKVENNVPTYARTYELSRGIYPIEIFVKVTRKHFDARVNFTENLQAWISDWKKTTDFKHKVNLTVIPMDWELALDI